MDQIKWAKRQNIWLKEWYCEKYKKKAKCKHFEECNSCALLCLDYKRQIELKRKMLENLFNRKIELKKSKLLYHYRNKAEFSFIDNKLGFRKKLNPYKSFSIKECFLVPKEFTNIARFLQKEFERLSFQSYDVLSRKGFLAYVVMRYSFYTKELMVNLVTYKKQYEKKMEELAKKLIRKFKVKSINWILNESYRDEARGRLIKSWNNFYITEKLLKNKYMITAQAFFQINPKTAEILFKDLQKFLKEKENVVDLYCGIGAISLIAAKTAAKVVGIDIEKENIETAKKNAKLNKTENVEFLEGDSYKIFRNLEGEFNIIIVDPPRAGLSKKLVKRINNFGVEKVIYVSCNPYTLKENLEWFSPEYKIKFLKAYDFYPHTPHIECLAVIERCGKH